MLFISTKKGHHKKLRNIELQGILRINTRIEFEKKTLKHVYIILYVHINLFPVRFKKKQLL